MDTSDRDPPPDPYDVLGVPETASDAEVTRAYRRLARELHPDANPHVDPVRFRRLVAAYETVRDRAARDADDASRRPRRTTASGGVEIPVRRVTGRDRAAQTQPATTVGVVVRCPACGGSGAVPRLCPACDGAGHRLVRRAPWVAVRVACPLCHGRRSFGFATCAVCGGLGGIRRSR